MILGEGNKCRDVEAECAWRVQGTTGRPVCRSWASQREQLSDWGRCITQSLAGLCQGSALPLGKMGSRWSVLNAGVTGLTSISEKQSYCCISNISWWDGVKAQNRDLIESGMIDAYQVLVIWKLSCMWGLWLSYACGVLIHMYYIFIFSC